VDWAATSGIVDLARLIHYVSRVAAGRAMRLGEIRCVVDDNDLLVAEVTPLMLR
jgi:hypothetical protein